MSEVGKGLQRVDGVAKVTGAAHYSYEVPVNGVAYGVLVLSTIARGRIIEIDTTDAEREPGVIAVITHMNSIKAPGLGKPTDPGDRVVQVLQNDEVLYSHQPIAVAVADTFERATHAALLVRARYQAQDPRIDLLAHESEGKPHDNKTASGTRASDKLQGDIEAGLAGGAARIDGTYGTPAETHNPLEPHATLAIWQGDDRVTLYDATQGITGVQKKIAQSFAIPKDNVRVISKYIGGGFGCKGSPWSHVLIAALAAKQCKRPVKIALARTQMFGTVGGRPQTVQRISAAASADGTLTGLRHYNLSTTSQFDTFLEGSAMVSRHAYACPAIDTRHRLVKLDIGTPTYMRAPGESSGSYALESAMDELAVKLDIDPLQLRLKSYAETDPDDGKPFSSKSLRECYRIGAEKFGWDKRVKAAGTQRRGNWLMGMGMATASYPANQGPSGAMARISPDGSVLVESGAVDLGTGTYTVMRQVAADSLGIPIEKVTFDLGDSEMPEAVRSGGSQTAASVSSAVMKACAQLKQRLVRTAIADKASPLFGVEEGEIALIDGKLVATNGKSEDATELVRRGGQPIEERSMVKPDEVRKKYSLHSFGAQFAEVHVDADLGEVRVKRLLGVFAAGKILNSRLARSQFMGGMVWGIGMALHEATVYDENLGRIMTKDLADYHVPTHADTPAIEAYWVEEEDTFVDPAGVKGVGEIGITGVAAAIANAVYNATGKRVRQLPITPEKLL